MPAKFPQMSRTKRPATTCSGFARIAVQNGVLDIWCCVWGNIPPKHLSDLAVLLVWITSLAGEKPWMHQYSGPHLWTLRSSALVHHVESCQWGIVLAMSFKASNRYLGMFQWSLYSVELGWLKNMLWHTVADKAFHMALMQRPSHECKPLQDRDQTLYLLDPLVNATHWALISSLSLSVRVQYQRWYCCWQILGSFAYVHRCVPQRLSGGKSARAPKTWWAWTCAVLDIPNVAEPTTRGIAVFS